MVFVCTGRSNEKVSISESISSYWDEGTVGSDTGEDLPINDKESNYDVVFNQYEVMGINNIIDRFDW